ncbi:hypothetical protein E2C01_023409 [Portunus trituberculatus]|uniref:Uncharacterized protein n=1 Tax=Portunus trituberculatus TaxID=210409 RepID=A0A5B7E7W4_PORTR|nr:hypothetical protein [Portunus trituberculatus]
MFSLDISINTPRSGKNLPVSYGPGNNEMERPPFRVGMGVAGIPSRSSTSQHYLTAKVSRLTSAHQCLPSS